MFVINVAFLSVIVGQVFSYECLTIEGKKCVFPFKVKDKIHTGCTKEGNPENRSIQFSEFKSFICLTS